MSDTSSLSNPDSPRIGLAFVFILPMLFLVLVILFYPFRFVLEFDPDEGINLIKSMMTLKGFDLYSEVWSDQPPLLTLSLSAIFRSFGYNVAFARLFILILSSLLLGAVVQYLQSFWSVKHAIIGVVTMLLIPNFTRLSVSVMIGLPSIAFAFLSFVSLAFWHRDKCRKYLILSALLLSISVMIKLYTLFLAGIFLIGILIAGLKTTCTEGGWQLALKPVVIWFASFSIVVSLVAFLFIGPVGFSQIIGVHLTALSNQRLESWSTDLFIFDLKSSWPLLALCIIGTFSALKAKRYTVLYLTAWISLSWMLLTQLEPLWYHHELLVTVPAATVAAIPVGDVIDFVRRKGFTRVPPLRELVPLVVATLAFTWFVVQRVPPAVEGYRLDLPNLRPPSTAPDEKQEMLAIISDYADETELIVTDRPMFAFRTGIAVPPKLAAFSGKRFLTGELTEHDVLGVIQSEKPEQVALTRFAMPDVVAYLGTRYRLEYSNAPYLLFIRKDVPAR